MLGKRICVGWNRLLLLLPVVILIPHLLSVKELNQQRDFGVPKEKPKKLDHLYLGPAAGEGLLDRLQCRGTNALNRTQFLKLQNNPLSTDSVALVTVFTIYNSTAVSRPIELVTVGNMSYDKVERSIAVLNIFLNFVKVTMPQSNVIILTDPASDLPLHRDMVTIQPIQDISRKKT